MKNIPAMGVSGAATGGEHAGGSLLIWKVAPSLFWYALLIASALALDHVLHRLGLYWVGRYLGILGTALIILSLAYSLRKRKVINAGSPRALLDLHEYMSWAGALAVLIHAGVHYNAVLPWAAVVLMLVVVASGFVGKNLIQEARAGLKSRERGLKAEGLTDAEVEKRLLLDAAAVATMQRWRSVHVPLTITFGTLALVHIVSILIFWRW
jgi:hypothetical protein